MAEGEIAARAYRFGEFRLLPHLRRLLKGEEIIPLQERALELLIVLVEEHRRPVGKDELFARVWARRYVEDNNLRVQINALREVLGRDAIANFPGVGYKFALAVEETGATPSVPSNAELRPAKSATNLPVRAPLIGRAADLAELRADIALHRLVTLTGTGGIGKTRLAIEFGRHVEGLFPDGVWLIDLAPLTDPALIPSAAATVLGVSLRDTQTPVDTIVAAIAKQRLLLIFDNCEYLVSAAAELVGTLLNRVSGLSVLATSQERLRLSAEAIYRLEPLALPPETGDGTYNADEIAAYGAIELFVARARAGDRRFQLDAGNAAPVAAICRDLEGLPLALEMAAARSALLGIKGLHQRLGERLDILAAHSPTRDARHRTLRAMVEWSHGLLDEPDRQVFRRLAIFRGGFTLDAAIAVAGADEGEAWATVDALERLIDKSLVTVEPGATPRYRLLETLRLFAAQELRTSSEGDAVAEGHARYFAGFFDGADAAWETAADSEWLKIYRPEIDNVRAALNWALADPGRTQIAVTLAAATGSLWYVLTLFYEGRKYFDRVESRIDSKTPDSAVARLLSSGGLFWIDQDRPRALALLKQSVAIYRRLDDPLHFARTLSTMGYLYTVQGLYAEAREALCEAQEILSAHDFKRALFNVMCRLGFLASLIDETVDARRWFGHALDLTRTLNDVLQEGYVLTDLAELEFRTGVLEGAVERGRAAVDTLRSARRPLYVGWALGNLAAYLVAQDNLSEARAFAEESLLLVRETGGAIVRVRLQLWALLGALENRYEEAARLLGYVDFRYSADGDIRQPTEHYIYDRLLKLLEANLLPADIRTFAAEGARWSEDQAVDFAIDRLISPGRSTT